METITTQSQANTLPVKFYIDAEWNPGMSRWENIDNHGEIQQWVVRYVSQELLALLTDHHRMPFYRWPEMPADQPVLVEIIQSQLGLALTSDQPADLKSLAA